MKWKDARRHGTRAVVQKIGARVNDMQQRAANWLEARAERMSTRRKKALLYLFCFCFGGSSVFIVANTLFGHNDASLPVSRSTAPAHIGRSARSANDYPSMPDPTMSTAELNSLLRLTDSLSRLPDGKRVFDSLLAANKNLADSFRLLEKEIGSKQKIK